MLCAAFQLVLHAVDQLVIVFVSFGEGHERVISAPSVSYSPIPSHVPMVGVARLFDVARFACTTFEIEFIVASKPV